MDMKRFFLYAIAIAALALAGCGGGGGGGMAGGKCDADQTGTYPNCVDPITTGPTPDQRAKAKEIAPAIVNPDGDMNEDGTPNFPETGDLEGTGDAGIEVENMDPISSRPTPGAVTVDAMKQEVTVAPTDIDAVVMVDGGMAMSLGEGGEAWSGSVHTRTINDKTETAVVYTNVGDPGPEAWTEYYGSGTARDGVSGTADGSSGQVTLETGTLSALVPLFMVDGLPMGPGRYKVFDAVDDDTTMDVDESMYSGSFNGISGAYECTGGACRVETNADSEISLITGNWTFTPTTADEDGMRIADVEIPGQITDTDYMHFGYWMVKNEDGTYEVNPFFGTTATDNEFTASAIASLMGSAEYDGKAAGMFVTKAGGAPAFSGQFTADADLTANFGNMDDAADETAFTIGGTVSKFVLMDGETMVDNSWMLMLNSARFSEPTRGDPDPETGVAPITGHGNTHTNTFSDATDGGGGAGEWTGMFFGPSEEDGAMPSGVAGKFLGHFSDDLPGHAIGAFGAEMVEPEEAMVQ